MTKRRGYTWTDYKRTQRERLLAMAILKRHVCDYVWPSMAPLAADRIVVPDDDPEPGCLFDPYPSEDSP